MANGLGGFANINPAANQRQFAEVDPVIALQNRLAAIQAIQTAPQTALANQELLALQQLERQLGTATAQQRLRDLQDPQGALVRQLQQQLVLKSADPTSGIIAAPSGLGSETISLPGALTASQQLALEAGGAQPVVSPGIAVQPIVVAGQPTGFSQDLERAVTGTEALSRAKGTTSLERQLLANAQSEANRLSRERMASEANLTREQMGRETIASREKIAGEERASREKQTAMRTNAMNVIRAARSAAAADKTTEGQKNFQLYGNRMEVADKDLEEITKKGFDATSVGTEGLVGSWLPNLLKTSERQLFEQSQRNFINAVLRKESGAVISESEFENARAQYFPQPGDSTASLAQKADLRKLVIEEFKRLGGQSPSDSAGVSSAVATPGINPNAPSPVSASPIRIGRFTVTPR